MEERLLPDNAPIPPLVLATALLSLVPIFDDVRSDICFPRTAFASVLVTMTPGGTFVNLPDSLCTLLWNDLLFASSTEIFVKIMAFFTEQRVSFSQEINSD